jgi:uncharacterized protein YndB with AHSA1/START domain
MTDRSVSHVTFVLERTYPAHPSKVFGAWADGAAKQLWMDDPDFKADETAPAEFDFRVGGRERFGGIDPDKGPYRYDALIYDIVPDERIVYCYEMYTGGERMSVSVATVQIAPAPEGARLTYTEQGAFLDALDKPELREEGTAWLLDNLGRYLAAQEPG